MDSLEIKRKIFVIYEITRALYNNYYNAKRFEDLTEEDLKEINKLFNELKGVLENEI